MIRSPLKWVGGKSKLRKRIIALLPPHERYVEVFAGAAWVLFGKEPSEQEVLNDLDPELVNFFRVVRQSPNELISLLQWNLVSREEFERLRETDPTSFDVFGRARRFFYLTMAAWGGESGSPRFQTSISDGGHGNRLIGALQHLEERLMPAHARLQNVAIECRDWRECVDLYDDEETTMYLDPPYPGNTCNYQFNLREKRTQEEIAQRMRDARAKMILTTYDLPDLRALFADFHVMPVKFAAGMPGGSGRENKEIIITNYSLGNPRSAMREMAQAYVVASNPPDSLRSESETLLGIEECIRTEQELRLARAVYSLLPTHTCFVDVFATDGWIMLGKEASPVEILNDTTGEILNFYSFVKSWPAALQELLALLVDGDAREEFWPVSPTERAKILRARRFYASAGWGAESAQPIEKRIRAVYARLREMIIEHLTWKECIKRYDDNRTIMYLDPSDIRTAADEQRARDDLPVYEDLSKWSRTTTTKFILVCHDLPDLRQLFQHSHIVPLHQGKGDPTEISPRQLIITNCSPRRPPASLEPSSADSVQQMSFDEPF